MYPGSGCAFTLYGLDVCCGCQLVVRGWLQVTWWTDIDVTETRLEGDDGNDRHDRGGRIGSDVGFVKGEVEGAEVGRGKRWLSRSCDYLCSNSSGRRSDAELRYLACLGRGGSVCLPLLLLRTAVGSCQLPDGQFRDFGTIYLIRVPHPVKQA